MSLMSKMMKLITLIYLTAALTYVGCAAKQMGSEALAPKEQTLDSRSPARLPEEHGSMEIVQAGAPTPDSDKRYGVKR